MEYKHYMVVGALALGLSLAGCGQQQALKLRGADRPAGIPTATPGLEPKGAASGAPAASPAAGQPTPSGAAAPAPQSTQAAQIPAPQSTQAAAVPPPPAVTPTIIPVLSNVQLPVPDDLRARWRQVQTDRTPLPKPQVFLSPAYQVVWWFDPIFGQFVPIGQLRGEFTVQATFRIRGEAIEALEIPYHVNQQYGFTVPPAIVQRMKNAGVGEWAEVFIYRTQDINPK